MKSVKLPMITLLTLILLLSTTLPANARSLINFNSSATKITTPSDCGACCCDTLTINGTSTLDRVWVCVKGPTGKTAVFSGEVSGGNFSLNLPLCDGPGKYVVWAGDNPTSFDGIIRFEVLRMSTTHD